MSVPWKAQGPLSHCVADDERAGVDETCQTAPQLTAPDVTAAGWQPGCDVPTPLEIPLLYTLSSKCLFTIALVIKPKQGQETD